MHSPTFTKLTKSNLYFGKFEKLILCQKKKNNQKTWCLAQFHLVLSFVIPLKSRQLFSISESSLLDLRPFDPKIIRDLHQMTSL